MKRYRIIGTLLVLTGLLIGCSETVTGPEQTISSQQAGGAQVVIKGEPRRDVIYAFGSPSVLLLTGNVENVGEEPAYAVRVHYTQGCVCANCGVSPSTVAPGETASFSMYVDFDSVPDGSGSYDITWCDNP